MSAIEDSVLSVLVPYRPDGGWRDRAWKFNMQRWAELRNVEVVVESPGPGENAADFNHPRAINAAARRATGDVFVVADADTAFKHAWVRWAITKVREGAPWVLPRYYRQLTEECTERVLRQRFIALPENYEYEWVGDRVSWSGLVVVPREHFERVGGYDERWEAWGGDDVAFACAMNTLCGPCVRLEGDAWHLWHPRDSLDAQPQAQHELMHRYLGADGDVAAMAALINERTEVQA